MTWVYGKKKWKLTISRPPSSFQDSLVNGGEKSPAEVSQALHISHKWHKMLHPVGRHSNGHEDSLHPSHPTLRVFGTASRLWAKVAAGRLSTLRLFLGDCKWFVTHVTYIYNIYIARMDPSIMTHIESSHDVYIKYVFNKTIAARLLHLLTEEIVLHGDNWSMFYCQGIF